MVLSCHFPVLALGGVTMDISEKHQLSVIHLASFLIGYGTKTLDIITCRRNLRMRSKRWEGWTDNVYQDHDKGTHGPTSGILEARISLLVGSPQLL